MIGLFGLSLVTPLCAQGITSAALQGRVLQADSAPIAGAVVTAILPVSGAHWQVVTDASGRYFVENIGVGGPYVLEARAVGFRSAGQTGVFLGLGQRYHADFTLEAMAIELPALTIGASVDPLLNAGRTGPAHIVSATELEQLPNLTRDLSVAAALGPLAALRPFGGVAVGGQNQGYNNLQVDGGVNTDLYLGRTPGGAIPSGAIPEVLPHAISLETVSEFQVLAAPFDVRLGNFAGGLLNAVTKSGTNRVHGSAFAFLQDGSMMASNWDGSHPAFASWQFGGTLSGPVVRDRAHFFLNVDLQQRVVPDAGPFPAQVGRTAVSESSAVKFQHILADTFRLEPGTPGPSEGHLPAQDIFGKITVQLGANGHVELSHHYAHGDRRNFMDAGRTIDTTGLSSVAGRSRSTAHTTRLIWSTNLRGQAQNEVIVSFQRLLDTCEPNGPFPLIQVNADGGFLIAGSNSVCPTTAVNQYGLEVTENLTLSTAGHLVTLGLHGELFHFHDPLVQVSAGRWFFANLDSLAKGVAFHYDRGLPGPSPGADFHAVGVGIYAQDRWTPLPRVTVTLGLRADIPFLPDAAHTDESVLIKLGANTGQLPSGNVLWSPRLGLNYDLSGNGTAFLRGGIGLFSGPPPYRWLGNGYRDGGLESVVNCNGTRVPHFDPDSLFATCKSTGGAMPRLGFFDRDLKLPQNLKLALGADRRLPGDVTASIDLLYTRAVHQIYVSQANLGAPIGAAYGEGGRPMYGTVDATGLAKPAWLDSTSFQEVFRVSNRSGDHSVSLSVQVRKRFGETMSLYAAYAFSQTSDRMSLINLPTRANFSNTPLDGTLEDRRLAPSFFETPHKFAAVATFGLPHRVQLSLLYQGASQPAYTYVIDGDANADHLGGGGSLFNDAVYVPRDSTEITLRMPDRTPATPAEHAKLQNFIAQQPCLEKQRGRIMGRNSCRNAWLGSLNARLTATVPLAGGRSLEITADIFNLPNLIEPRWGQYRDVTTGPSVPMLKLVGWDPANVRGAYQLELPKRGVVEYAISRWRGQAGIRFGF